MLYIGADMHVYITHTYINAAKPSKHAFGQIIWSINRVNVPMIAYKNTYLYAIIGRNGPYILKY